MSLGESQRGSYAEVMTAALINEMAPLWDEAVRAFRSDPAYVIEVAQAASSQLTKLKAADSESSGV